MLYIGEPILKPLAIAIALIYAALASQPLWATTPDSPGHIPQTSHMTFIDANRPMDQEQGLIQTYLPAVGR